ncbi:XRE family transcriptional regulator [Bacillus sp. FJAT-22090]|uniref:helix-turn-helix domain-containing protein n=1 Tax=Bacillus sp. FJAT-22090 TaxID=1581038 RepID=UPI0006BD63D6|nr:helix-turn-helix transcriptional regulator [Bacillus sp. FJAT-22090]ALC85736.1 XRE family transcriptional regulator [Bacillus sp. FJAT-22090]
MILFRLKNASNTKLLIAKKGLTLRAVSQKIGVSHSYLSQVINEKKYPSATIARKLSDGLSTGIEDIFLIKVVDEHTRKEKEGNDSSTRIGKYR